MSNPITTACLLALALLAASSQSPTAPGNTGTPTLQLLALNRKNDRQRHVATVGEPIEITLQAIGPAQWGPPQLSSSAVRFEHVMLKMPPIPAGPTQVFVFTAVAVGETEIQIPYRETDDTFTATIEVRESSSRAHGLLVPDQSNTTPWKEGWTNLLNDARQTFVPSLPRLTRVEVELIEANPGNPEDDVTMTVFDPDGEQVAVVTRTVSASDCERVLFVIPDGGIEVSPGRVYSIRLSSGSLFGWKYVMGGYPRGEALFNSKRLVPSARSTFLFRTFGVS